ncbi:hypothetical protein M3Y94_00474900 [Aphelenchoides besseyi]|nr:hypothetical protein M3Y94_00474900 [Aphelenchoides besseyi]
MYVMKVLLFAFLFTITVESYYMPPWIYGPKAPTVYFSGRITNHGKPVSAHISIEIEYKNGEVVMPLSVVQVNSLADYHIGISGLLLQDPKLQSTAFVRVQPLSLEGKNQVAKFEMDDNQFEYIIDFELSDKSRKSKKKSEYSL